MGMHFGVLATSSSWDALFTSLKEVTGDFHDLGPVPRIEDFDLDPKEDGFPIVAGDWEGGAFLLDTSMMLTAHEYDRLIALSRTLDSTVAACLAETTSGTYSLLIARSGTLERLFYHCVAGIYEPFQLGDPLPSESRVPLQDVDGNGFFEAFGEVGLDFHGWYEQAPKHAYLYTLRELEAAQETRNGPVDSRFDAHCKEHGVPNNANFKTKVVSRRLPDGSMGYDILPVPPKRSFIQRLFKKMK